MAGGGGGDDITRSKVTGKKAASFLGALRADRFTACFFHLAQEKIHCSSRVAATNGAAHFRRHVTVSDQTSSRTPVDVIEDELFDDDLRPLATRFLSCNHLLPTRLSRLLHCSLLAAATAMRWCCSCRQPDSEFQLALE